MYFDHILPLNSSQSLPTSHIPHHFPPYFMIPLSEKQEKQQKNESQNRWTIIQKQGKQNKNHVYIKSVESFLLCPTTPRQGACLWVWLLYLVTLHWRKLILHFTEGINCKQLIAGGNLCLFSLLSARILSGLNICRSCVCCQSLQGPIAEDTNDLHHLTQKSSRWLTLRLTLSD